jgi:hypothetical protein
MKVTYKNIRRLTLEFLKDFKDVDITTDALHMLVIEYGWSDYEESETNVVTVNYVDHTINIKESGYSVDGGEFDLDNTTTFLDERDLFANFKKGINNYFN